MISQPHMALRGRQGGRGGGEGAGLTVALRMAVRISSSVKPPRGSMDCSVRPKVSWKM